MIEHRDYVALDWLTEQIADSLGECASALLEFRREPLSQLGLQEARQQLHQIQGSLNIIEFSGAERLLGEMIEVVDSLAEPALSEPERRLDALLMLCDEIPAYLSRLRRSRWQLPASLMMMFNELRAAAGRPLLSSGLLFTPRLPASLNYSQPLPDQNQHNFQELASKLRQMYRLAFAAWQRGENPEKSLGYMAKAAGRLTRLCAGTPQEPLWLVALALLEGLATETVTSGLATDAILARLQRELDHLAEFGRPATHVEQNHALCKDMLFYIACSPSESRLLRDLRRLFRLDGVIADCDPGDRQHSRDVQMAVKKGLAETLREAAASLEQRCEPGREELQDIADALAILNHSEGLYSLKALSLLLREELSDAQQEAAVSSLRQLAQTLEEAEQTPVAQPFNGDPEAQLELDGALQAVSQEGRRVLFEAQETLLAYVAQQFQSSLLAALPQQLDELAQALDVAEMRKPADILSKCGGYIRDTLAVQQQPPSWEILDALADAIAAVDYYLECGSSGFGASEDEALMAVAQQCVQKLSGAEPATATAEVIPWPSRDNTDAASSLDSQSSGGAPAALEATADSAAEGEPPALLENGEPGPETAKAHTPGNQKPAAEESSPSPAADATPAPGPRPAPELDPEILDIFLEEAGEVLLTLEQTLPRWRENLAARELLIEARRAFHTLKGSGRMVAATDIAELAWALEDMLNRVVDGRFEMDALRLAHVDAAVALLPGMLSSLAETAPLPQPEQVAELRAWAKRLTEAQAPAGVDALPWVARSAAKNAQAPADDSLLGIFINEADNHLQVLEGFLAEIDSYPVVLSDEVQRSLHTLKGASNMAEVWAVANLVTPLEALVKELRAMRVPADQELIEMMGQIVAYSRRLTESLRHQSAQALQTPAELLHRLEELASTLLADAEAGALQAQPGQLAPGVLSGFLTTFSDELQLLSEQLSSSSILPAEQLRRLAPGLGGLAFRAEEVGAEPIAELIQALQILLGHVEDPVPSRVMGLAEQAVDGLMAQLNQLAAEQAPTEDPELLARLRDFDSVPAPDQEASRGPAASTPEQDLGVADAVDADPTPESKPASAGEDEVDQEILEIFLEEAGDLLEGIDQSIQTWTENPNDAEQLDKVQRYLHTLKGGARLSGQAELGDLSHQFETAIAEELVLPERDNATLLARLHHFQDGLVTQINALRQAVSSLPSLPPAPPSTAAPPLARDIAEIDFSSAFANTAASKKAALLVDGDDTPALPEVKGPQEMVKVPSQLLERLINLAGETSIARARSEEQVSDMHASLEEMDITVVRLQEQVRRLDMETEAQILFRQEQVGGGGAEGFDPLEFDRYSQLQQYSRSLLEAASDLVDLRNTLLDKNRDMETLLMQQSRIHGDLQEGLMRSQMVHFSRMVPRLRRGVRQVAGELGKKVDFKVYNADGEMDRRVLERVIPALEHMLRNAIGHGIEDEARRRELGKAPVGEVAMRFDRQGGDVVIAISDDGAGIDLEAVRAKAIAQGLISEQAVLSDRQLLDYIFHAGFSTASNLTQISGRGVGLDVVRNEIKQLGGSVDIRSEAGRGTRFEVRLPFTVSVNRALLVSVAGEVYAVPLNNIEGIVRVSPYELDVYYQNDDVPFEYAGQTYNLRYLGQLMGHSMPRLEGQIDLKPVLLVRNADPATAVQIDGLLGSKEVVVKTLGPQFAAVPALSGATVMGDGSVVVILDLLASIRADSVRRLAGEKLQLQAAGSSGRRLVMVVDDSVTVRKVTSRLLERQKMDVLLARDGMDAVTTLQEADRLPDVILLDIEMPRMDGFEVAVRLKGTPRTSDIPVIMISSRTGEKHRERAASLGIKHFLGKPYQESQLLRAITDMTTAHSNE